MNSDKGRWQDTASPLRSGSPQQDVEQRENDDDEDGISMQIGQEIGRGAQAVVKKATLYQVGGSKGAGELTLAAEVAVKMMTAGTPWKVADSESMLQNLRHPNLVRCLQVILPGSSYMSRTQTGEFSDVTREWPKELILVTEYCLGGSLYDQMQHADARYTWKQRLGILKGVASGVQYLHSQTPPILHRDLKSNNVLLAQKNKSDAHEPIAKVADFGLARKKNTNEAMMTRCVGTWRWMAPEVFAESNYSESVDVYSFGILAYELLSYQVPYCDTWPISENVTPKVGLHIVRGKRPTLSTVDKEAPSGVLQLMQECWQHEPDKRPSLAKVISVLEESRLALYSPLEREARERFNRKLAAVPHPSRTVEL